MMAPTRVEKTNRNDRDARLSRGLRSETSGFGIGGLMRATVCWLAAFLFAAVARCGEQPLDWDAWERLPVLEAGRRMPLDTFARSLVTTVCGRPNPKLWLPEGQRGADSAQIEAARELFPEGQPRRFRASELVFSWLVEPQRWQAVPLLIAEHKQLRQEVFVLPTHDSFGRLRYVSPIEAQSSREFHRRLQSLAMERRQREKNWEPSGVDRSIERLDEAYGYFAEFTTDPRDAVATGRRLRRHLESIVRQAEQAAQFLQRQTRMTESDPAARLLIAVGESLDPLLSPGERSAAGAQAAANQRERQLAQLRQACAAWAEHCRANEPKRLGILAETALRHAMEAHFTLYDPQVTLRVVPALNPAALEPDRDPEDDFQPWLGFRALIFGSDALLEGYPLDQVRAVRTAWERVVAVYNDRGRADRPAAFTAAMNELAESLSALGRELADRRDRLVLVQRDEELLRQTEYPPPGFTNAEVFYNRLDPFFWSWLANLAALACLALSFGRQTRAMLYLGLCVLAVAIAITTLGFGLRMAIMRLVPLTNMFETVAFVSLCVPLLGVWFTLLPILWPGLRRAWSLTDARLLWRSVPVEGEADVPPGASPRDESPLEKDDVKARAGSATRAIAAAAVLVRLALIGPVAYFTTRYISLSIEWADQSWGQRLGELAVWLVAAAVVVGTVYFTSRLVPVLLIALFTVPREARHAGGRSLVDQAVERRVFALVGAAVGMLAALVGYYAPDTVIDKDISHAQPVLRDNFWLFVHVLTITASYAAGALAWGVANISLGYYLFGGYRREGDDVLPPPSVAPLAQYAYKATQVAVLLLAAGTILGALWADKAWGHFWSWDAKEVWSLLTLLAYMAILHARHIGWAGNFGMAFGSVLGATFILMAWYGVNFLLPAGKHSYGSGGAGGQWYVGLFVAVNWLFVLAATIRYHALAGGTTRDNATARDAADGADVSSASRV